METYGYIFSLVIAMSMGSIATSLVVISIRLNAIRLVLERIATSGEKAAMGQSHGTCPIEKTRRS